MSKVIPFRALRQVREPAPIRMAKKGSTGEIYVYDVIGAGFFEDGVTAKQFAKDLKALGDVETLNIYINSPGGSVFEGTAIHNIIARQKARKIVQIDGLAASIASVIAMAGDEIRIAENGMMMIHNPWALAIGDAAEMRKMADALDKIAEAIRASYLSQTGMDEEKIIALMDAETWMSAADAVEMGFADSIIEAADIAAMAKFDLSIFHNAPESLKDESQTSTTKPHPAVAKVNARLAEMRAKERLSTA
jgi:ATP-dependent Clp protease protease subunit